MKLRDKIRNCIRAYVMGDALGVPFEFQEKGTFTCTSFTCKGTYNKPAGTWSDDTSVLLCLIDAIILNERDLFNRFQNNLKRWYFNGEFTVDGLFDIGMQTSNAIRNNFDIKESHNMGNGALFHCLPVVLCSLDGKHSSESFIQRNFLKFCKITHYNKNCFDFGLKFCWLIRNLLLDLPHQLLPIKGTKNNGDVISTFYTVEKAFSERRDNGKNLFEDLCSMVNEGNDTDTNAAFLGLLLGTIKPVNNKDWVKIREYEYIDHYIDLLIEKLRI